MQLSSVDGEASDSGAGLTLSTRAGMRVRALRAGEDRPIRELYDRLSPNARYQRFFSVMPALPDSVVRLLSGSDHRRQLALIVQHEGSEGEQVIGLANLGAIDDSTGEVGLVVRDDWQNQGVGTELAGRLLHAAEAVGFDRFIAYILPGNVAINRILKKLTIVLSTRFHGGVSEVVFVRRPSVLADDPAHN